MLKWVKDRWCRSSCLLPKVLELQIVHVRLSAMFAPLTSSDAVCSEDCSLDGSESLLGMFLDSGSSLLVVSSLSSLECNPSFAISIKGAKFNSSFSWISTSSVTSGSNAFKDKMVLQFAYQTCQCIDGGRLRQGWRK